LRRVQAAHAEPLPTRRLFKTDVETSCGQLKGTFTFFLEIF
jgi:hypothetical protein